MNSQQPIAQLFKYIILSKTPSLIRLVKSGSLIFFIAVGLLSCVENGLENVDEGPADSVLVITSPVSSITTNAAIGGGEVTLITGEVEVTQKGICWAESSYIPPGLSDNYTNEGSGFGSFTSELTGLTFEKYSGKTYAVRAYALTSKDTVFGEEVVFETLTPDSEIPIVELSGKEDLNGTTFTVGGSVVYSGSSNIEKRGISWGYSPDPMENSEENFFTYQNRLYTPDNWEEQKSTDEDVFWTSIQLEPNTTYYFRAYATNHTGTGYSENYSITTSADGTVFGEGSGVVDIDGNQYRTIIINGQEWMAENLRVRTYADGTPIPYSSSLDIWEVSDLNGTGTHAFLGYPLFQAGALYNTYAVRDQKLCPQGWHLPTLTEWASLVKYLDPNATVYPDDQFKSGEAPSKLWSMNQYSFDDCTIADKTNTSGFTAYYVPYIGSYGSLIGSSSDEIYYKIAADCSERQAVWWSNRSDIHTVRMEGSTYGSFIQTAEGLYYQGACIRCIKD